MGKDTDMQIKGQEAKNVHHLLFFLLLTVLRNLEGGAILMMEASLTVMAFSR